MYTKTKYFRYRRKVFINTSKIFLVFFFFIDRASFFNIRFYFIFSVLYQHWGLNVQMLQMRVDIFNTINVRCVMRINAASINACSNAEQIFEYFYSNTKTLLYKSDPEEYTVSIPVTSLWFCHVGLDGMQITFQKKKKK